MAKGQTKLGTKVPKPKKRTDMRMFPHVSPPKRSPLKSRVYTKSILREDPSEFGEFGFGDTGLTGSS